MTEKTRLTVSDPLMVALTLALALFGIAMIYSAGELEIPSSATGIWQKQAMWLCISVVAFIIVLRIELRWLEWVTPAVYGLSILSLLAVLIIGSGDGPRSWIRFGGIGFQPSELAKLATIFLLAKLIAARERPPEGLWELWPFVVAVLVPFALTMAQPDLGTAAVFLAILLAALYWSGLSATKLILFASPLVSLALAFSTPLWGIWFLFVIAFLYWTRAYLGESLAVIFANIAMGVVVLPVWRSLAPYQQVRIVAFLQPEADPRGAGWHLIQSQVAIGSGGWLGKGFTMGTQKRLAFLPEQHTDFIIAVVGEELGFVGVFLVLSCFAAILWRLVLVAQRASDPFASTVVFCVFALWFAHLVANVGMTVGLLPITGLPLPFVSYGGSFLFVSFIALAVVQQLGKERKARG
ncbi:MAG: rod shape-determining protein RodA [Gemmatimonadales bacterium]|jgi:rod shape determining protein RodA